MRTLSKIAVGAAMLASAAVGLTVPANAGVTVGVTIGAPVVGVRVGNPCVRPWRFRPSYCGYPVYEQPLFVDGVWLRGPVYVRTVGGQRYFWVRNGWARDRVEFHRKFR
ncbi:MAG TPA: hypothetical protein VGL35_13095 [Rhizomicrobium sp.]|jgi:hypothetical protein